MLTMREYRDEGYLFTLSSQFNTEGRENWHEVGSESFDLHVDQVSLEHECRPFTKSE